MSRKNRKDWGLEDLLSVVGFVFEIVRVVVNALRKRGGTVDHLRRLLNEPDLVERIFDLIVVAEQPMPTAPIGGHPYRGGGGELPPNHYRVRVNRGPFPPMPTLEGQFSKNGVSDLYDGKHEWKRHSSRMGENDVTAEDVVMVEKQFTPEEIEEMGGLESENIIAWGLKNGLVPADEKETYAFGINPETCDHQLNYWLVGLGASAQVGGLSCVAVLFSGSGRRFLGGGWFGGPWLALRRFLFVRKCPALEPLVS